MEYSEVIKKSIKAMMRVLEAHYPRIKFINYHEDLDGKDCHIEARMRMALYIELIKAGIIT